MFKLRLNTFATPFCCSVSAICRLQFGAICEFPKTVKIVEVGPRDGLQNEKVFYILKLLLII